MLTRVRNIAASALLAVGSLWATVGVAQDLTPVRFTLDFVHQGVHGFYYRALQKGYFEEEGLDVTIDQGEGSAATVTRIMSGAYDAGFGDINAIIQQASLNAGEQPVMVYQVYSRAPFVMVTRKDGPIQSLEDLPGTLLGGPAGSPTLRLFPGFARANGIDPDSIEYMNMAPNLQEQLMVRGEIAGTLVFNVSAYINLIRMGEDPDQYNWFTFADNGLDVYSNGVMVSQAMLQENPEAVAGLVRAINRSMVEIIDNPGLGIEAMLEVEPLLDAELEGQRLDFAINELMMAEETLAAGLGEVDDTKLAEAITVISEAYELEAEPDANTVYTRAFLSDASERGWPNK
ncbi:MAG: ABC transporter substrate-binding protein [Pseudomonadota bacterium]